MTEHAADSHDEHDSPENIRLVGILFPTLYLLQETD